MAGLALVCPLLATVRDVPAHRPVVAADDLGDAGFREYFVVQTPAMLERYERVVAPGAALVDHVAMERLGEQWQLTTPTDAVYDGPVVIVAGRQDSVVGYASAVNLLAVYPRATVAVLDGAGHALPHEQSGLLAGLLVDLLARAESTSTAGGSPWRPRA